MGFFSNIFKRKTGGTWVGNLIRGAASKVSGGILGSGAGLAAWQKGEDIRLNHTAEAQKQEIADLQNQLATKKLGANLVDNVVQTVGAKKTSPNLGESVILTTLKSNWAYILGGLLVLVLAVYLLVRRTNGGNNHQNFRKN